MARYAFSMIEVLVVLTLLALLSGIVAVSLAGRHREMNMREVRDAVSSLDRAMRQETWAFGRTGVLEFDSAVGAVRRLGLRENEWTTVEQFQTSPGVSIIALRAQHDSATDAASLRIPCDSSGRTETYGLAIRGAGAGREIDVTRWWVVAGLTGMTQECADETTWNAVFEMLADRADAP